MNLHISAPKGSRFIGGAKCMKVAHQEQPFLLQSLSSTLCSLISIFTYYSSACSPSFAITAAPVAVIILVFNARKSLPIRTWVSGAI